MNADKFTKKSLEAIENCQKQAMEYGNQEIKAEHILYSLLTIEDSLIVKLLTKMNTDTDALVRDAEKAVAMLPKVGGSNSDLYMGTDACRVVMKAEDEAQTELEKHAAGLRSQITSRAHGRQVAASYAKMGGSSI